MNGKTTLAILLILLMGFSFFLRTFPLTEVHYWDPCVYLQNAEIILGNAEGGYELDFRPPFLPLFIAFLNLFWHSPYMAQIGVGFLSVLGAIPLFLLLKRKFNSYVAFIGFLVFCFSPTLLLEAKGILTDNVALSFFVFAVYFLDCSFDFRGMKKRKNFFIILALLFLVLSILTKFTYILGVIFFFVYLVFKKAAFQTYFRYLVFGTLFILPYLIWNFFSFGNPFYAFLKGREVVSHSPSSPLFFYFDNLDYFSELTWIIGLFLLASFLVFSIYKRIRKSSKKALNSSQKPALYKSRPFVLASFLWSVLMFLALSSMAHKEMRYSFPLFFVFIVLSSAGYFYFPFLFIEKTSSKVEPKRRLFYLLFVIFVACFYAFQSIVLLNSNYYGLENNYPVDFIEVSKWLSEMDDDEPIYALTHYPMLNYYSNRSVIPAKPRNYSKILLNCSREAFRSFNITEDRGYFVSFPEGYDEKTRVSDAFFSECDYFEEIFRSGNEGDYGVVYRFDMND